MWQIRKMWPAQWLCTEFPNRINMQHVLCVLDQALRGAGGCASLRWELPFYFLCSHKSLRGFRFIYSRCYFMESTVGTDLCQDPWNDRFTWLPSVWETYLFPCKTIKGRQGRRIDVRIVHIIREHESNISNSTVMTLYTSSLFPSFSLRCLFII